MRRIITLVLLAVLHTAGIAQNLVTNDGFEQGKEEYFEYNKSDKSNATIGIDTSAKEGDKALKIITFNEESNADRKITVTQKIKQLRRGKHYKIVLSVKASKYAKEFSFGIVGAKTQRYTFSSHTSYYTHSKIIKPLDRPAKDGSYTLTITIPDSGTATTWLIDELIVSEAPAYDLKEKYVSLYGSDDNEGSIDAPFKTINFAISTLSAGQTLFIREGVYHENVKESRLYGKKETPITITRYKNENVLLDGTIEVDKLRTTPWVLHEGNIMKTTISSDTWQLFEDRRWLINARWPNANFEDKSIWNHSKSWARLKMNDKTVTDTPHDNIDLTELNKEITNASFVCEGGLNLTHVVDHTPSTSNITLAKRIGTTGRYYLENHLNLIDTKDEWFYDKNTNQLYWWSESSSTPIVPLRCKTQDHFFKLNGCEYLTIKGLHFFGNTVRLEDAMYSHVTDCDFEYPSCSRRMLGEEGYRPTTSFKTNPRKTTHCSITNCTFYNTDSEAIKMYGNKNIIDNCHFENIDHSTSTLEHGQYAIYHKGNSCEFNNNTVINSPSGNCLYGSLKAAIVHNNFFNHCSTNGGDVGVIHLMIGPATNCNISHNWIFNSDAIGVRFDTPIPPRKWSNHGFIHHQVTMNVARGLMIKGEHHQVYHNTCFNSKSKDITVLDETNWEGNITRNNAANQMSGHRGKHRPLSGVDKNNWNGYVTKQKIQDQLRDVSQNDFRPRHHSNLIDQGSVLAELPLEYEGKVPDIGAYEYSAKNYWIPGRREAYATMPIPSDKSIVENEYIDLMWRPGYDAKQYDIYFGKSFASVSNATTNSSTYQERQDNNIFTPGKLEKNTTYYWRIDVIGKDGITKGKTWQWINLTEANTNLKDLAPQTPKNNDKLLVFPNPTKNLLNIDTDICFDKIEVYSMDGRIVRVFYKHKPRTPLSIASLPPNIYMIKCISKDSENTQHIIKL
ncbi:T9SS type A sorting domain-containing protein [Halosquirtibacter xylanolyticus]|uniref:T9SS type A sorting domain-containing protein n=1 Tax=Halosquirtibacter xylanolyticus TaxID=3374599 RepID=UPI003747D272|nr:T9SS type A sorting domain-containing protein [Prolixibacteraceae bacterium]